MTLGTLVVLLIMLGLVAAVLVYMARSRRAGKRVGCGGCSGCSHGATQKQTVSCHACSTHDASHTSGCSSVEDMLRRVNRDL